MSTTPPGATESNALVFVVDDDHSVRKSLGRLLRAAGHVVETFASADAFLARDQRALVPACLVLDVGLPGVNGMELQQRLHDAGETLPIVFITGQGSIPMGITAMKAGAQDFLVKPIQDSDLLRAIANAHAKHVQLETERRGRAAIQARLEVLTPREREVMALVVTGMLNKQIADQLGASVKTIKVHRGRVMHKMGARSLAELVRLAEHAPGNGGENR